MEHLADSQVSRRPWLRSLWALVLLVLLGGQAWQTLGLFGPEQPWQRLGNDQPILSGRHALHLYHGCLGAGSLWERGTLSCYDPAFQAGYPKTPVFDSGSRPAELFLALAGGTYRPEAYKVGLAVCCLLMPLLLAVAAHGAGLGGGAVCLATAAGLLASWSTPGRYMLELGDLDWWLGAGLLVAAAGLLVRFHQVPGGLCWVGLLLVGLGGWFLKPVLMAGLLPLLLVYYLTVGTRHGLAWHAALLAALAGGVLVNLTWLRDALAHWWICTPPQAAGSLLRHRTPQTLWEAPLWGDCADRGLAVVLLGAACVGVGLWNGSQQRAAARLFGLGAGGMLALALAGIAWEPLSRLGTERLLVPALWFAAVPTAHAVAQAFHLAGRWTGGAWRGGVLVGGLLALGGLAAKSTLVILAGRACEPRPLSIGLGPEREELLGTLRSHTTTEARILWEDGVAWPDGGGWTALLPVLTGRAYLGGLDPQSAIEHSYATLKRGVLAGRPLAGWSNAELEDFCRRYHLGWVACWSPAAVARFRAWPGAELLTTLPGETPGCLFQLKPTSFVLKGQARLLHADCRHIALADVVPEDGKVVLSLHYQAGLTVSTGRVRIERDPDPNDPIPFIRLRLTGPVARVVLTWEEW
jgi:hypothetical protein